ncbi:hypothetical protein [Streptomyces vastus]|uniref:Uncharacterized protein n=1 Tax=Streptomyces vastus TaxID=285451 RepID=A0ABP6EDH7_9ACTN
MTTDAGPASVRESLQLALLAEPEGSPLVDELAEAAADHYHLNYSKHPVPVLFRGAAPPAPCWPGCSPTRAAPSRTARSAGCRGCWATWPSTRTTQPTRAPTGSLPCRTRIGAVMRL